MKFDPEKSLFDLAAVRWTFFLTLFASVITTIVIILNSDLYFKLDYDGINKSIEIFRVPLGILAVGISLIGIYGANHRSEQTKRQIERTAAQIELTRSQNNFANYYKHIEEFEKYCAKIEKKPFSFISTRELYRKLFPYSRTGDFGINKEVSILLQDAISGFLCEIKNFQTTTEFAPALMRLINLRNAFLINFSIEQDTSPNQTAQFSVDNETQTIFETTYGRFINAYVSLFEFTDKVLHFDISYKTPSNILYLKNIDLAGYMSRRINPYIPEPFDFKEIFSEDASNFVAMMEIEARQAL